MRLRNKFLTCALLALYGGVSLLGHALHWLSPEDHHHHPLKVAHSSHGSVHAHHHHHGHHDHDGCETAHDDPRENGVAITASDSDAHLHACDICAFLDQVKSQQPQIASGLVWHRLVAAAPSLPLRSYASASHGLYAPRGPPSLV